MNEQHLDLVAEEAPIFGNGHANGWLLSLYPQAALPEIANRKGAITQPARPASVRLCGPLGGARHITDPAELRREGERLIRAAALLEREQTADLNPDDQRADLVARG